MTFKNINSSPFVKLSSLNTKFPNLPSLYCLPLVGPEAGQRVIYPRQRLPSHGLPTIAKGSYSGHFIKRRMGSDPPCLTVVIVKVLMG